MLTYTRLMHKPRYVKLVGILVISTCRLCPVARLASQGGWSTQLTFCMNHEQNNTVSIVNFQMFSTCHITGTYPGRWGPG